MTGGKIKSALFLTSVFVLCFASSAMAVQKGDLFLGDPLLCIIALVDMLLVAAVVHKIYHSIFEVFYFSFKAILGELFSIFIVAMFLVMLVPSFLENCFLWDTGIGYIYFIAIFLLMIRRAKK